MKFQHWRRRICSLEMNVLLSAAKSIITLSKYVAIGAPCLESENRKVRKREKWKGKIKDQAHCIAPLFVFNVYFKSFSFISFLRS